MNRGGSVESTKESLLLFWYHAASNRECAMLQHMQRGVQGPCRPRRAAVPAPFQSAQRQRCPGLRLQRWSVLARASDKAVELLAEGKRKYESGDRMAALNVYEKVLGQSGLSQEQRLAAMYGTMAVHASFGDVELAQMTLRDAVLAGLDYESAKEDPDLPEINSSPQILIQLGRFNKQLLRTMTERAEDAAASGAKAKEAVRQAGGSTSKVASDVDLARLLGGAANNANNALPGFEGVDASPMAIAKRVSLVVLAGIALGLVLFFAGLEYMFPKDL